MTTPRCASIVRRLLALLPTIVTLAAAALLLIHGPVLQIPGYNDFADRATLLGVPNARDVISNLGFAIVGVWGLLRLWPRRLDPGLRRGWWGYALFLAAVTLTAFGSAFYHLAPSNGRLVWDRLPIALACAGLLAAVRAESRAGADSRRDAALLSLAAVGSVVWWRLTDIPPGSGDLRPYVLIQGLPLVLIPLWQWTSAASSIDRGGFGLALLLYVAAKVAEFQDRQLFAALGCISGHTLKHLLASLAVVAIVVSLSRRCHDVGVDRGSVGNVPP